MVAAKLPCGITRFRGRYRVRIDAYGGTHSLGVFDTVRDARAALLIAKGERARGMFIPPGVLRAERHAAEVRAETELTLGEWAERWLEEVAANPDRSHSTVLSYRSVLRTHVVPELGATRLVDLTPAQVAAHLATLRAMPVPTPPRRAGTRCGTECRPGAALVPERGHQAPGRGAGLLRLPGGALAVAGAPGGG